MNVLVYSGAGTTPESVKHCLETLRLLLSPYYAVFSVESSAVLNQPWINKSSVFVVPGGADLPICRVFNGKGNDTITKFVRKGGIYLGFCSGGYYASSRCEFEVGDLNMEVSGPRELGFFPGTARGCVYKGFKYGSETGVQVPKLNINKSAFDEEVDDSIFNYYNGGGMFVNAQSFQNVEILATYDGPIQVQDEGQETDLSKAAVIMCNVGSGKALLTGTHPEFTPVLLKESVDDPSYNEKLNILKQTNTQRINFLKTCLRKLGLKVNDSDYARPSLTPLLLTSYDSNNAFKIIENMEKSTPADSEGLLDVGIDRFKIHKVAQNANVHFPHKEGYEDPDEAVKDIYVYEGYPERKLTSYFDIKLYYKYLYDAYLKEGYNQMGAVGSTFMYGEVLTSTSVLMDKNIAFLRSLPDGFTIHGTTQVSGRGRSGNIWVNPPGVIAVSTLLKMPISLGKKAPIVFVQYIASLAYIEAVLNYDDSGSHKDIPIKIKWPNDIYIAKPEVLSDSAAQSKNEFGYTKIGGILINTNVFDECYYLIAGCGINISNAAPTTSVNLVIDKMNELNKANGRPLLDRISTEKFVAKFLAIFDSMFNKFKVYGFHPFMDLYYQRWLHTDQYVNIQYEGNVRAKITGISPDWGMLCAKEVDQYGNFTGASFELQPDGNSFDMFNGLISRKR
ncbi:biotin-protein ligase activity protein [[Candida] boidinii]|nr:biotin-protein ligase activity protein [[Candida] boidinii]OWB71172.1 biotin-protein ligase activity protein [[Candida] boidinii]OWB77003.1 biotin-protein ligase activity protein [[Candida] boidinii]